jgi:hypothetical protein
MISVRSEIKWDRRTLCTWFVVDADFPRTMPMSPSDTHRGLGEPGAPPSINSGSIDKSMPASSARMELIATASNKGHVALRFFHDDGERKFDERITA